MLFKMYIEWHIITIHVHGKCEHLKEYAFMLKLCQ